MTATLLLMLPIALLIGITLGLFGGGGSILAVPALVYLAHRPAPEAVALSLAMVGSGGLNAVWRHHRRGHVHLPTALVFGSVGAGSAYLFAQFTHLVSEQWLMISFGAVMLIASAGMRSKPTDAPALSPDTKPTLRPVATIATGFVVGALTGFLGVGGGFLAVPALTKLVKLHLRVAIGTSLMIIAFNSMGGFIGHLDDIHDMPLLAALVMATVVGSYIGATLTQRLPVSTLRRAFARFLALMGLLVVLRAAVSAPAGATSPVTGDLHTP